MLLQSNGVYLTKFHFIILSIGNIGCVTMCKCVCGFVGVHFEGLNGCAS